MTWKPGKSNVKWKHSFLDFGPILGEGWLAENYINHFYSCFDSSAVWTLHFTMYYGLCNTKVGVVLPNWQLESQGAIYPCEWCSNYELRASSWEEWRRKQTEQVPSWKQDSILGRTVGLKWHTNWKTMPPLPDERAPGLTPRLSIA